MSSEIELKLLMGKPGSLDDIYEGAMRHLYRSGGRTRTLRAIYYDTPDGSLRAAGYSLRVRDEGDGFVLTAKGPSGKQRDGVERGEWECSLPSAELDRDAVRRLMPDAAVAALGDDPLLPAFETTVERREVTLTSSTSTIEVAVDQGQVVAGDRREPIAEVELELKAGDPADLYELALDLTRHGVLLPSSRSKSERGFDLASGHAPDFVKADRLDIAADTHLDDGLAAAFAGALAHLVANLHWVGDAERPEAVHQARVALRRMRSAFAILKRISWSEEEARLAAEAKWLAAEMGPARDLDVLVTQTIPQVAQAAPAAGDYAALTEAIAPLRQAAHDRARAAASGLRCSRFLLELGLWSRRKAWRTDATPDALEALDRPANAFATSALSRLHHKAGKRGRHFDRLEPAQRHELRIALKKLRYAGDFLLPAVTGPKKAKRFAGAMAALQDRLGRANDRAKTAELLGQLAPGAVSAGASRAIGAVLAVQAMDSGQDSDALSGDWHDFAAMDVPWKAD